AARETHETIITSAHETGGGTTKTIPAALVRACQHCQPNRLVHGNLPSECLPIVDRAFPVPIRRIEPIALVAFDTPLAISDSVTLSRSLSIPACRIGTQNGAERPERRSRHATCFTQPHASIPEAGTESIHGPRSETAGIRAAAPCRSSSLGSVLL